MGPDSIAVDGICGNSDVQLDWIGFEPQVLEANANSLEGNRNRAKQ
jgi:hypothetical protein